MHIYPSWTIKHLLSCSYMTLCANLDLDTKLERGFGFRFRIRIQIWYQPDEVTTANVIISNYLSSRLDQFCSGKGERNRAMVVTCATTKSTVQYCPREINLLPPPFPSFPSNLFSPKDFFEQGSGNSERSVFARSLVRSRNHPSVMIYLIVSCWCRSMDRIMLALYLGTYEFGPEIDLRRVR